MKKTVSSILSVILCLIMVLGIIPLGTVCYAADLTEKEDNNSYANATTVGANQTVNANLSTSSDVDFFKFTPKTQGVLSVSFNHTYSDSVNGWYVNVYSYTGTGYTQVNDTAEITLQGSEKVKIINLGVPAGGDYYIKVLKATPSGYNRYTSADYSVTVSFQTRYDYETEDNNGYNSADIVKSGEAVFANLAANSDVDYYKFTANTQGVLSVSFNHAYASSVNGWYIYIYKYTGTGYAQVNDTAEITLQDSEKVNIINLGVPAGGDYYIKVLKATPSGYNRYTSAEYSVTVSLKARNDYETEDNNNYTSADIVKSGEPIFANLAVNSDVDFYKFTANTQGVLSVSFNHTFADSVNGWYVYVYRYTGTGYAQVNDTAEITRKASEKVSIINLGVPAGGDYYIKVLKATPSGYNRYTSAEYSLTVTLNARNDYETEDNNNYTSADIVKSGDTVFANLASDSDVDFYKFTANNQGVLSVGFNHTFADSVNGWYVYVYRNEGTGYVQVNTTAEITRKASEKVSIINLGVPAGGDYYIKVLKATPSGYNRYTSAEYSLTVNFTARDDYETEDNDGLATADTIKANEMITASLTVTGDADYYCFEPSVNDTYEFMINHTYANTKNGWMIYVYQYTGTEYIQINNTASVSLSSLENYSFFKTNLEAGKKYYIKVVKYTSSGYTYYTNSEYSLFIKSNKPAVPTYTVSYNANGGIDAPQSQKKTKNVTLKLSTAEPVRSGYTFLGWSTSSTAVSASYSAGDSYTANASAVLYAVWKRNAEDNTDHEDNTNPEGNTEPENKSDDNINAVININENAYADSGTLVKIKATATGVDTGYHLELTVNGITYMGSRTEVTSDDAIKIKGTINYTVKIVSDDHVETGIEKNGVVKMNEIGILLKILLFILSLFGSTPETTIVP